MFRDEIDIKRKGVIQMEGSYLLRSMLYVPAYNEKLIEKSLLAPADAIIYDLEDSVPEIYKEDARCLLEKQILSGVFKNRFVFVRVNPKESRWLTEDLAHVLYEDIAGFVLPKINMAQDLQHYHQLITNLELENGIEEGHFKFIPLIETASAIMDILPIAMATKRTIAMCFGGEDFLNDIQGVHGNPPHAFDYPRAAIATAARAAGILPIDTPYLEIRNEEGFLREETRSYEMGFAGIQILSPRQIMVANRCFTPNEEEVKRSREIMDACRTAAEEGSGVAMYNGRMVGPPMRKRAEKVLAMMEQIHRKEGKRIEE